jgi:predicted nucleic acid-binding protein
VLEYSRAFTSTLVTTDEVLTEVLAFTSSDPDLRKEASRAVRRILTAGKVRVLPQSRESFLDGLDLYEARPDKGYSLTDCISMRAMQREKLTEALTNDRHFEQEAFRVLNAPFAARPRWKEAPLVSRTLKRQLPFKSQTMSDW